MDKQEVEAIKMMSHKILLVATYLIIIDYDYNNRLIDYYEDYFFIKSNDQ